MIPSIESTQDQVRAFLDDYFQAWQGDSQENILAFYSDDVVIELPTGRLEGRKAVQDSFVRPFITGFPGNVHVPVHIAHAENLVAVEWRFEAVHAGPFAGIPASGKAVNLPGCSIYEYDLDRRLITAGRIYFDVATLIRQIGVQ